MIRITRSVAVAVLAASFALGMQAQMGAPTKKSYVTYAAEPQTIAAGRPASLEIHFRVNEGYHVNSHTPKSEMLIPTLLKLDVADGVKAGELQYPAGKPYTFSFDPTQKLDVYASDFTVKLPVTASAGEHTVNGTLHYQACDNAACYPPRSLPVQVLFRAK